MFAPLLVFSFKEEFSAGQTPELTVAADYIFTLLGWFGVFGYVYGKTLFSRKFWQVFLPFIVVWDIFIASREFTARTDVDDVFLLLGYSAIGILMVLPEYVGLYLYGYRERLQQRDAAIGRGVLADLGRNAWSGLRLLFFMRVSGAQFRPGLTSILAGFIVITLVIGLFGYYSAVGDVYFDAAGAAVLGSIFFLVALVAIILCTARNQVVQLPLLLTATLSAAPVYLIGFYALRYYTWEVDIHGGVGLAFFCWGLIAVMRAVGVAFGRPQRREWVLVMVVASVFTLTAMSQYLRPDLFYVYDTVDAIDYDAIDQEDIFYRQPALVANKVGGLAAQTPGFPDIYFLGFAGNGDQTLFRREARFAQDLMDRNFGTGKRSLTLVNDLENLATEPFANRHNLQTTLLEIGRVMDVEDDVLFLFLTSHGGKNAALQVSLHPFDLDVLRAKELRDYLDQSGIAWRVIVISACYSGSFIDALADDQTLIMTASSADATSFGCSDERELTYFGEALLKEELSRGKDLAAAFAAARKSIEQREREEGIDPSNPQIRMGERIAHKLHSMQLGSPQLGSE